MTANSLLARTGQSWKFVLGVAALLAGSIAPLFEASGIGWTAGTVIACAGYAFTLLAVRCPACGSRWFWQAALDAAVYAPIFKGPACPACRRDYSGG
ncbi:MAG: hypothetical protein IT486_08605 [Gammaproteobacteria bacterium]|nr:hypothetical protein [Gammaproteobacteria bacterium]